MCGKFTQMMSWDRYVELADILGCAKDAAPDTVTPMRVATVIRLTPGGKRAIARMRWGFVPADSRDPNVGTKFIHARAETIDEKPTYRDAFLHRRGLVVVHTFNEGEEITPTKTRQYIVSPKDGKPLAIAVIWERWGEPHGGALESFAMVTVPPNALIGSITERMPAIIQPEDWAKWLGEVPASVEELKALLRTHKGDWTMEAAGKPPPPPKPKIDDQPTLL